MYRVRIIFIFQQLKVLETLVHLWFILDLDDGNPLPLVLYFENLALETGLNYNCLHTGLVNISHLEQEIFG